MIELYLLEQLEAFSRLGTLTAAAKELHVTQPAMTRSMRRIEAQMGVPLFHRDKRRLTLNAAGETVADYARRILDTEREMRERAQWLDRRERTVSVAACGTECLIRATPHLAQFFRGKALLSEVVPEGEAVARLRGRECQLALLHERPDGSDVSCQRFLSERLIMSVPSDHALARKDRLVASDLDGVSVLAYDLGFWIPLLRERMPGTPLLVQTDAYAMEELVESSTLVVLNSDLMLEDGYVASGRVDIPLDEDFARCTYYVCCLDGERERYAALFNVLRAEVLGSR